MPTPVPVDRPRYRGAIIGWGGVARQAHLPAFLRAGGVRERVEIVALVDGADGVAGAEGIPQLLCREQLAELGPLDFLDICTPTASHLELILWGIAQGYHVLCEKPVALNRAEAARIAAAARERGRVVMPCHQYRFNPVWLKVSEWLRAGAIGRWHLAEFAVYRELADPGARPRTTPWRGTLAESRGGVLLDHGTHLIYPLLDLVGMPSAVSAWTGRLRHREYDVEDTASLLLEYPDRVAGMLLTWAGCRRENRLRFVGEAGTIAWEGGELRLDAPGRTERLDLSAEVDKSAYHRWFAGLFRVFLSALDAGAGEAFLQDIAQVAAVLELAYESARTGRKLPAAGAVGAAGAAAAIGPAWAAGVA